MYHTDELQKKKKVPFGNINVYNVFFFYERLKENHGARTLTRLLRDFIKLIN